VVVAIFKIEDGTLTLAASFLEFDDFANALVSLSKAASLAFASAAAGSFRALL
jgi:hypothetical protein